MRKWAVLISILFVQTGLFAQDWSQIGSNINGESNGDRSGGAVSISADGTTIAIGAINDDDGASNAGHVRVYTYTGNTWVQKGGDLDGISAGDNFGSSVALSEDGNVIVIGAIQNPGGSPDPSGYCKVYDWDGSAWVSLGIISGDAGDDRFGTSVSINGDGSVIAIGATQQPSGGTGYVKVLIWDGTAYVQWGSNFMGVASGDRFGAAVDLNGDGDIVAIGAPFDDLGTGSNGGAVRIYEWDGSSWTQLGSDIYGESGGDNSGGTISINEDGTIIAIGADPNDDNGTNAGHVRVYEYDGSGWSQLGSDVDGATARDEFGSSVSLSADGKTFVAGALQNYSGSPDPGGYAKVYVYDGSDWTPIGSVVNGTDDNGRLGTSVAMRGDGIRFVVGAPEHNPGGTDRGLSQVYQYCSPLALYYRPSMYSGGYNISTNGGNDGSIQTAILNGASPYEYSWIGPVPASGSAPTGLEAGSYFLQVVDQNGCEGTAGPWTLREP